MMSEKKYYNISGVLMEKDCHPDSDDYQHCNTIMVIIIF